MLAYVGVCWPILRAMWAHLVAMLAYVGLMLTHVEPKDPKNGNSKKNTVKRRIFWWSAAYLGAMLAHLGAMLAHLGAMLAHLGAMLAHLGARLAHLGARLAHLGAMLAHLGGYVGPSWRYVGSSCGLCWPRLTHLEPQAPKNCKKRGRAQNTVKRGSFWRARGPTMLAHLVARLAYVHLSCGQCGPILWLCWPMLASCWSMLSQKIRKMGTAKKHCKTQDILMVGGLSWGYVGPSWGYVGLSWGQCGPILGLCWPILELCWPILGLSWPILGARLPHAEAMLVHLAAYVGPCWPILSHKLRKMAKNGKSTKHRKTRGFLALPTLLRLGRRPLSPTERRETPSARTRPGGPWPDLSAYARQPARGPTM